MEKTDLIIRFWLNLQLLSVVCSDPDDMLYIYFKWVRPSWCLANQFTFMFKLVWGKFDKNPFTKHETALTFDPEIKSLHHWVQLEPSMFMSRQSVTLSLMIFFLPWAEIWAHFSQFSLEQDCRFVSDLMEIPEGIPELWCLLSIRLQWPLLSKIWMSSSLSHSFYLRQISTNLHRDCSKPLKDCEAGVTCDLQTKF